MLKFTWQHFNEIKPPHGSLCLFRRRVAYPNQTDLDIEDCLLGYFYKRSESKNPDLIELFNDANNPPTPYPLNGQNISYWAEHKEKLKNNPIEYIILHQKKNSGTWVNYLPEIYPLQKNTTYQWMLLNVDELVNMETTGTYSNSLTSDPFPL